MSGVLVSLRKLAISSSRCGEFRQQCRRHIGGGSRRPAPQLAVEEKNTGPSSNSRVMVPTNYRFVYPEFLPDPNLEFRNFVREKLERVDMMRRRTQIDMPEFYVGSVLGVTCSDQHALGKTTRFVGICIQRRNCGLRADFTLRNVVDNQGMEILYELYDPRLLKVEVLRLEKRLDSELLYLRDAEPEFSTFSFDMEAEFHTDGAAIPVNPVKVTLRPPPWFARWERMDLQGAVVPQLSWRRTAKSQKWVENHSEPWEQYDLMKQYRKTIPEEEQKEIYAEVYSELHQMEMARKKMKRKKTFIKPKKVA